MFKLFIPVVLATSIMITGCQKGDGFETTESGLKYQFVTKGASGKQPQEGEIVTLNMSMISEGDSILMQVDDLPIQKIEEMWNTPGGIEEAFTLLSEGDSLIAKVNAGDLYQRTWRMPLPPNIDESEVITCHIGLKEIFNEAEYRRDQALSRVSEVESFRKQTLAQNQEQIQLDGETIDKYLKKNKINAQTTSNGLRYIILEEGSGPQPQVGDQVKVNYTGNILQGSYFDTSIEEKAQELGLHDPNRPYGPFEFVLGTGGVIHGWDEGIALLNKGAKARLYIPSTMGYGSQPRSEVIVANSILEFEVELVDIVSVQ